MKSNILGLLAIGLLAGPLTVHAIPSTGTYDLTLTGTTSGSGSFFFDSSTGLVTGLSVNIGNVSVSNSGFGALASDQIVNTCFVEWAISTAGTACSLAANFSGFAAQFTGTSTNFNWNRNNIFFITTYTGTYAASLRSTVPEPGTLALLGLGLAGLGLSRRRKAV